MQGVSSGACCVTALVDGDELIISNVGDCRAVLCQAGIAEAITKDHRASEEDERKRIEDKVATCIECCIYIVEICSIVSEILIPYLDIVI